MKDIRFYNAPKYKSSNYKASEKYIFYNGEEYVTSLSFVQEPDFGEGSLAYNISQYPLEDILDKFGVYISDFYPELNTDKSHTCYLEFASDSKKNIEKLMTVVGKHVYNREVIQDSESFVDLVVENDE